MPELGLNTETVQFIIDKVHEFHELDEVIVPEESEEVAVNEDMLAQFSADYSGDPYYRELTGTINELEPDQQMILVALMWVGRGDYSLDEWGDALGYARESWTERTATYLLTTPLVADYLAEGLQQFETLEE